MTLFQRIRRIVAARFAPKAAPLADPSIAPDYPGEIVMEVSYAPDGRDRWVITQDAGRHFRVHREHWATDGWEQGGTPRWEHAPGSATIVKSLKKARALAGGR